MKKGPNLKLFLREHTSKIARNNRIAIAICTVFILFVGCVYIIPYIINDLREGTFALEGYGIFVVLLLMPLIFVPGILYNNRKKKQEFQYITISDLNNLEREILTAPVFGTVVVTRNVVMGFSKFKYRLVPSLKHQVLKQEIIGFANDVDLQIIARSNILWGYLGRVAGLMDFLILTTLQGKQVVIPLEKLLEEHERRLLLYKLDLDRDEYCDIELEA